MEKKSIPVYNTREQSSRPIIDTNKYLSEKNRVNESIYKGNKSNEILKNNYNTGGRKPKGYVRFFRNIIKKKDNIRKNLIQNIFCKWRKKSLTGISFRKKVIVRISVSKEKYPRIRNKPLTTLDRSNEKEKPKSAIKYELNSANKNQTNSTYRNINNIKKENIELQKSNNKYNNNRTNTNTSTNNVIKPAENLRKENNKDTQYTQYQRRNNNNNTNIVYSSANKPKETNNYNYNNNRVINKNSNTNNKTEIISNREERRIKMRQEPPQKTVQNNNLMNKNENRTEYNRNNRYNTRKVEDNKSKVYDTYNSSSKLNNNTNTNTVNNTYKRNVYQVNINTPNKMNNVLDKNSTGKKSALTSRKDSMSSYSQISTKTMKNGATTVVQGRRRQHQNLNQNNIKK